MVFSMRKTSSVVQTYARQALGSRRRRRYKIGLLVMFRESIVAIGGDRAGSIKPDAQ